jgi:DNA-binding GntR family transcriptional regulator
MNDSSQNGTAAGTETLATVAYRRIRQDIIMGALSPGRKLRMAEMCERYGMGLSPMREALSRLGKEGLVLQSDRRGFFVTDINREDLDELIRSRCLLYEVAVRESVKNGDSAWEDSVILSFHRLESVAQGKIGGDGRNGDYEVWHRKFHTALISACRSRSIIAYCEQLFDQSERYRIMSRSSKLSRDVNSEHRDIMTAALKRDVGLSTHLLLEHIKKTGELFLNSGRTSADDQ